LTEFDRRSRSPKIDAARRTRRDWSARIIQTLAAGLRGRGSEFM